MTDTLTRTRWTREDYQKLPEGPPHYELVGGELLEMTRPFDEHAQVCQVLTEYLNPYVRKIIGGKLVLEPNLYLPGIQDVYHPDLAYVGPENISIARRKGIYGVPHFVCEIISSSTERIDREQKLPVYQVAGVRHLWFVTPRNPVTIEELVLGPNGAFHEARRVSAPQLWEPLAFPGLVIDLAEVDSAAAQAME